MAIRKRIGIMVPATNTTVEPDFHRIAPPGVTIHSQRLWIGNADTGQEGMDGMNAQLEEGARHLAQGKVDVVNMTGTTNSFYRDLEWSNEMERVMSRGAGGIPAVATSPSVVRALNYFGAKKISVATPYPDWKQPAAEAVLRGGGLRGPQRGGGALGLQGGKPGHQRPGPRGHRRLRLQGYAGMMPTSCSCSCTAWRSMEAAAELEQRLGRPVVTAIQATAWRTFRKAGITQSIGGNGRLLELMPPVED